MAASQSSKKRVVDDTEERDSKRQCTAATASIKREDLQDPTVEPIASTIESENAVPAVTVTVTTTTNDELPTTTSELMEVLCGIISDRYTREEALRTLEKLNKWAFTKDGDFLKLFHACNGVLIVLNFIKKTMNDGNCVGQVCMECIEKAAKVIGMVIYPGENKVNEDIANKIATSLMECDGITALINASKEYSGGDDVPQLNALYPVWCALQNISNKMYAIEDLINKDQAIALFDTGIDIISQLKSVDGPKASSTLCRVFFTFSNIVSNDYVTKKYFQDNDILSKCLEVFKKDDVWTCQGEELLGSATRFFRSCCSRNLWDKSSDFEMLLPLLVMALKEYPSNSWIRNEAMYMLDGACSLVTDKKIVERSGVVEVLGSLLNSDDVDEADKNIVRYLIHKITAP